jgi:hypothetical protein
VNAVIIARNGDALPRGEDLENAGRILARALQHLLTKVRERPDLAHTIEAMLADKPVQECLVAMLGSNANPVDDKIREYWRPQVDIAVRHLQSDLRVRDVPRLLRMFMHASLETAAAAGDTASMILRGANNASPRDLDSIVETIDWMRHQPWPDAVLQSSISRLRREAVNLQKRNPVPKAA